jgi:ribosomal protein L6P/L9E
MLWYGPKVTTTFTKRYKNQKKLHRLKVRHLAFSVPSRLDLNKRKSALYIPSNWTSTILQPKRDQSRFTLLYLTSTTYYFKLILPTHGLLWVYDVQTNTILVEASYISNFFRMYWGSLTALLHTFTTVFFVKLKFKGKGYYLYKNSRNTLTTQFGHSHRIYIYSFFVSVKFLSKTSVLLFGFSKRDLLTIGYQLRAARPINLFTGRGVRFNRQILYRKTGKISTHR